MAWYLSGVVQEHGVVAALVQKPIVMQANVMEREYWKLEKVNMKLERTYQIHEKHGCLLIRSAAWDGLQQIYPQFLPVVLQLEHAVQLKGGAAHFQTTMGLAYRTKRHHHRRFYLLLSGRIDHLFEPL